MEFISRELFSRFRHPQKNFEEIEISAEVRWDPLTGRAGRITAHKSVMFPAEKEQPDISEGVEASRKFCVFCSPNVDNMTPKLPEQIFAEEKLEYRGTILFPNIFPYGAGSAVLIYGRDRHYIPVGEFGVELQVAALTNCREYISRYQKFNPAMVHSSISQNYLPASGGSLVHPHLQVQVDEFPPQHQLDLVESARRYSLKTGSNYWQDLLWEEEQRQVRWLGRIGEWGWFTPFAPWGFKEVAAALPGKKCVTECSEKELTELAEGIENVQRYYRAAGVNSFNFTIYSTSTGEESWSLFFRMICRASWESWYRNDRTFHEVMLGEAAVFEPPERVAEQARPYFAGEK